jgi:hypothetical protein
MPPEMIQAVLTSWPFWVAVVAIAFLVLFRSPIIDFLRRVTGISREGITAGPPEQRTPTAVDSRTAADQLLSHLDNEYVRSRVEQIQTELDAAGIGADLREKVRVLERYTAAAVVIANFERINGLIYGSQLGILSYLNSRASATRDQIRPYYEEAAKQHPFLYAPYSFDDYMGFLIGQGLILQQGDSFLITVKGRAFLSYLVSAGLPLDRLY